MCKVNKYFWFLISRTWREVTHLWYFWPAKGVPEDYDSVIDFLFEMRSYMKVAQTAKEYDEEGEQEFALKYYK